jgi:RNA polymerase primary sigma factor
MMTFSDASLANAADDLNQVLREAGLERAIEGDEGDARGNAGPGTPPADAEARLGPATSAAIYFRDISSVRLLTAEQEVELAQRIDEGENARRELGRRASMPDEQRELLEAMATRGDRARQRMVEANLRLVVSVARKYANRGLPLLDLIQEGNIGLAHAVDKYDWRRGYRFCTYAYWWIRQGMLRALAEQGRPIRVPSYVVASLGDVYKAARDLQQELGREPGMAEVAARLELSLERVHEILLFARQPVSLDTPVGAGPASDTLGDLIADRGSQAPHELAATALLKGHMRDAMQTLSPREREVLRLRFGLEGVREHSLSELAARLGVTSERVRQIEVGALGKLRKPGLRRRLREYLQDDIRNVA